MRFFSECCVTKLIIPIVLFIGKIYIVVNCGSSKMKLACDFSSLQELYDLFFVQLHFIEHNWKQVF